ncbi:beta-lactamase [Purpureocillium lavendulum]|uniref:Beta-lactamase n=1 Tax=Purpureocillium lavendulum TaxID=1247861 RepID=A0AB34FRP4_9HYPO|nr:beta-lactamase [Purpureocillium lavendulum]
MEDAGDVAAAAGASNDNAQSADTMTITTRRDKSIPMRLLHALIRPLRPRLVRSKPCARAESPRLSPPRRLSGTHTVAERRVDGIWLYDVARRRVDSAGRTPKGDRSRAGSATASNKTRIYYFAGGGWLAPPSPQHWAFVGALTDRVPDVVLTVVSPPLAPACPASVSMPQLRTLYSSLMAQAARDGEAVVFAGDSSGGNLALCLTLWALADEEDEKGPKHPARHPGTRPTAVMVISPTTDLRHEHGGIETAAKSDPVSTVPFIRSTAKAWCARPSTQSLPGPDGPTMWTSWTACDPRVSPALADLRLFARHGVQVHGVVGTADVLAPEAVDFMYSCRDAGAQGQWLVWEGQMHCFPLASRYRLRESVQALEWVVSVLRDA